MEMKVLFGVIDILIALYLVNLVFSFVELSFIDSKWILIIAALFLIIESFKYFKKKAPA